MPTRCQHMLIRWTRQGGNPSCVAHSESMCWHSVGMSQLGHLRLRHSVLNIQGVKKYLLWFYIYLPKCCLIYIVNRMTTIIEKIRKNIPKSIFTISIENTRFLRDVLRAYSFISTKHAFWKIKTLPYLAI